ncbi:class IIb bacteriocin, lactobin A/cerein 7B family [Massilia sp. DD77]
MQELTFAEMESVNGGRALALAAIALGLITGAEQVRDFTRGLIDGLFEAQ